MSGIHVLYHMHTCEPCQVYLWSTKHIAELGSAVQEVGCYVVSWRDCSLLPIHARRSEPPVGGTATNPMWPTFSVRVSVSLAPMFSLCMRSRLCRGLLRLCLSCTILRAHPLQLLGRCLQDAANIEAQNQGEFSTMM